MLEDEVSIIRKWQASSRYRFPDACNPRSDLEDTCEDDMDENIQTVSLINSPISVAYFQGNCLDYMNTPSLVASPLAEFNSPAFIELADTKNRRVLINYFCTVLSHLIVFKDDAKNPFRRLLLPLSYLSSPVKNAIFALSSAHLECRGVVNEEKSLDFHNRALQGLFQLLSQKDQSNVEETLGTILLLVYYEALVRQERSNLVNGHLKGAIALMKSIPSVSTPTSVFLERAFHFYDVITALSLGTAPNISTLPIVIANLSSPSLHNAQSGSPLSAVDTLLGLFADLWPVIHRLSSLLPLKTSLEAAILSGQTSKIIVLSTELDIAAKSIELSLTQWRPSQSSPVGIGSDAQENCADKMRFQAILNNAEAYRHSAFVYLYRVIHTHPRSHPSVQDNTHVSLVACSNAVRYARQCHDGPMSALLWPLFVAACEATTEEDRVLATDAFCGIEKRQCMNNIRRAWEVVQEVWRKVDLQHGADVNWRDICKEKGFNIVLG